MKIKTSELIDQALDFAVAKALGVPVEVTTSSPPVVRLTNHRDMFEVGARSWVFTPTTHWAQGGPIIDREIREAGLDIWSRCGSVPDGLCAATYTRGVPDCYIYGPTPLIAAMRCYVASKLGDEVDVPEELT